MALYKDTRHKETTIQTKTQTIKRDSDDKEAGRTLIPAIHKRGIINTDILQWASF